jgi:acetyl-CoA C-acetyltransferase
MRINRRSGWQRPRAQYSRPAVLRVERGGADKKGIEPLGRLVRWGVGTVEPGMYGLGPVPVPAVKQAIQGAGWAIVGVNRFEINKAFAAITLALMSELGVPDEVVNV